MSNIYKVIGLMSGTSLDGLDIAYCQFEENNQKWKFKILCANTLPYSEAWKKRLQTLENATAFEYAKTNVDLGHYFGEKVNTFICENNIDRESVNFISSHGHTIFHQPEIRLTTQIADINAITAETRLPVIGDFRTLDVALGGQGAPLVPIGDKLLFGDYQSCLNLGGIANISFMKNEKRIAFDISPCNMILNYLAEKIGKKYDKDGLLAKSGIIDQNLLKVLNEINYYKLLPPKSLGKEWFLENFLPIFQKSKLGECDLLATAVEHIAIQIANILNTNKLENILLTGGGALNKFLVERIQANTNCKIIVPNNLIVNYKEALIFAFLGVLRARGEVNCLSSVTGASVSNCGGLCSGIVL